MMKVSFVIPVFNAAPYLPRLFDSLKAQDHSNWEALCTDDGSSDGSIEILREAAATDQRIRVFSVVHGGSSGARNKCLDNATGDLIAFVDADDFVHPGLLSVVVPYFSDPSTDAVTFDYSPVQKGADYVFPPLPERVEDHVITDPISWALKPWKAYAHDLWRTVYRREVIGATRFYPGIVHQDMLFSYQVWGRCRRMIKLDAVLYAYVQTPDSVIRSAYSADKVEANFIIIRELADHYACDRDRLRMLRRRLFPRIVKNVWKQTERSGDPMLVALARRHVREAYKAGRIGFGGFSLAKMVKLFRSVLA